ncbi:NAD(P)-dependent dehydrogenase (short-subunit alcohol dehydrogenase family) [Rhodobium orientis]|uniref:SDR family NAD(P)-dependent oxidoreductase n=1 Tax=Rhodobium orientis TaxID=34017 RepID=UPI001475D9D2|nr:SDR family NAD(P)-dependent oxidoreductase [Rhodobium orientis]MBB4304580.1 NAD(P)-dependent dehydrogenase (short-subunit alcohol dehydrogenase family) [Rhodobium orientis]
MTGAAHGLGRRMALDLAKEGAAVAVNDVNADAARRTADEIVAAGGKAAPVIADVSDSAAVARMVEEVGAALSGSLDILINNAGIGDFVSWPEITDAKWRRLIDIHLTGTFNCCRAVLPGMIERRYGKVLNISSVAGKRGDFLGNAHYTAAKAGIIGLTKSLAADVAAKGVNVNALAPGLVRTELTDEMSPELKANTISRIAIGRLGEPEEISNAALFLVSDAASYIVGETLSVNGGSYMD